ncbi:MAG: hypothetical protein QOE40_2815 [Actinomycetota bacterium]|nr:hypothetical protein [Actinomycetota bacterium]
MNTELSLSRPMGFLGTSLRRRLAVAVGAVMVASVLAAGAAGPARAAKSDGCEGGGFQLVNLSTGAAVASGDVAASIASASLGDRFGVRGRYIQFDVRAVDFAVLDYAFTGAPNPQDMTGGVFTPVFASKVPDHRGLTLTSGVVAQLGAGDLVIQRTGPGLSMKIQAKDCAAGGVFQMEPERSDRQGTRIVHTLAQASDPRLTPFYFDNPNFRERQGQFLGADCTSVTTGPPSKFCVKVSTRTNIGNDFSPAFVARDSAQVAERVDQPACNTATPVSPSVEHCGGVSIWDVASGGRMGFVTGEDAVEVANPPTDCVQDCQAQNQVRGRLAVLGFPFPVPAGSRLTPRESSASLPPVAAPTAPAPTVAKTPAIRPAVAGKSGGPVSATARWRTPSASNAGKVLGFQVRALRLGAKGKVVNTKVSKRLGAKARSHAMTLKRGTYRFQVRVINAASTSAWSVPSNKVRAR